MKSTLTFLFIMLGAGLFAQVFTEFPPPPTFDGKHGGSFADVDGDGDQDILFIGDKCESAPHLYENDGNGNYSLKQGTTFEYLFAVVAAFSDVDGDGDPDLLFSGWGFYFNPVVNLYINDGTGTFSKDLNTAFVPVSEGSIAFSDVDNDGDEDVLLTGYTEWGPPKTSTLYKNDGTGIFTEESGNAFEGVSSSSIAFSDVDGDNDQDLLITGLDNDGEPISRLYLNDGTGIFDEDTDASFEGISNGAVAFADVDGDLDQDLLITGRNSSENPIAKLYTNNGAGLFTEETDTFFEEVASSRVAFADVDGDTDPDLLITGLNNEEKPTTKLYTNNGDLDFVPMSEIPFPNVSYGSIAFADVDGDIAPDVLITGSTSTSIIFPTGPVSGLFINDGDGNFSGEEENPLVSISGGSIAFADVDGDEDQDLLLTGTYNSIEGITQLYQNNGSGVYSEVSGTPFDWVRSSSVAFADVDGDDDDDVLITGLDLSNEAISKLYYNDGAGNFDEATGTPFVGVFYSSVAFADIDGDNDEDLLITGSAGTSSDNVPYTKLYRNYGNGLFIDEVVNPFEWVTYGSVAFSDVDGDNDQDLIISGWDATNFPVTELYFNDGTGAFEESIDASFEAVGARSSLAFSDVDNDGDQDVLITGRNMAGDPSSKLYLNDGSGLFSEDTNTPFANVMWGSVSFSDVDVDGDEDVLISGTDDVGMGNSRLYTNNGAGTFTEAMDMPFFQIISSSAAFGDVDGDGVEDLILAGTRLQGDNSCGSTTRLYINEAMLSSSSEPGPAANPIAWIHPNPNSSDEITINYRSGEHAELKISLLDANGKEIRQFQANVIAGENSVPLEVPNLPKGFYVLSLEVGGKIKTLKLINL